MRAGAISRLAACVAQSAIVADPKDATSLGSTAGKHMRREDGPRGDRSLCAGIRASDLQLAADKGWPWLHGQSAMDWAAMITAHNLVLRGGEVGVVDNQDFCPPRDLSLASIDFMHPCAESQGFPWLAADVVPIKDTSARAKAHRLGVRRRGNHAPHTDPLDVYDAVQRIWERLPAGSRPRSRAQASDVHRATPLFTKANGEPMDTTYMLGLARALASFLSLPPEDYGGKSFRVGGATDWAEVLGEEGRAMLKKRGRWDSDCDKIYARALLQPQLLASAALGRRSGRDLERVFPGWVQPAHR